MGSLLVEHIQTGVSQLTAAQQPLANDPGLHPQGVSATGDLQGGPDSQEPAAQPDLDGPSAVAEAAGQLAQLAELVTKKAHHATTFEIMADCFSG